MAKVTGRGRTRAASPDATDAGQGANADRVHDANRQGGAGGVEAESEPRRADWAAAKLILSALEAEGCPVCRVYWPDGVGPLWGGVYGNAKIEQGDPLAVLADGRRVPL